MVSIRLIGAAVMTSLCAWSAGCAFSTPMQWKPLANEELVEVSITHARLDPDHRQAFDNYVDKLRRVMDDQPGIVGHSLRREIWGDQVWTYTVWRSSADRNAFVRSGLHRRAMVDSSNAILEMRVRQLQLPYSQAPRQWTDILEILGPEEKQKR